MVPTEVRILRDDDVHLSVDAPGLTTLSTVGALSSRVVLYGDLDVSTVAALDVVVERLLQVGRPRMEFDLDGLAFLAIAGISAFQRADRACAARGGRVRLERVRPHARKVLRIVGGDDLVARTPAAR